MKTLFLFFLLLNAAFFYFQNNVEDASPTSTLLAQPKLPVGASSLVLLRERGLGGSEPVKEAADQDKEKAPVAEIEIVEIEVLPPKLVEKAPVSPAKPVEKKAPQKSAEAACFTFGPFVKGERAELAIKSAKALSVKVDRRQESQRTPKGYWVYLASSTSYQAAKRKVAELQKKGVKDLFIMGNGSRKNAISLGLFKNKDVARARLKQVNKLGLKAELETQYRVSEQSWLDMSVAGDQTATVASLTEMAERFPEASLTQRKCQ